MCNHNQINFKDILCDFQDHNELRNNAATGLLRDLGLRHIGQHRNRVIYDGQKSETLSIFKAKLRQKVKTEFQIAKVTGKIETFSKNWAYYNLLTEIQNTAFLGKITVFHTQRATRRQSAWKRAQLGPLNLNFEFVYIL